MSRPPRAAIFDCDGLLVDTRRCWEAAYRAAIAEAGGTLDDECFSALRESLNGASVGIAAQRLGHAIGGKVSAALLQRVLEEAMAGANLCALPGAERLLATLDGQVPLAVASNAPVAVLHAALHAIGLREYFAHMVSADEVAAPKPDPAVYLEACRRLAVDPRAAIAFEDSPLGAAAARAAGIFLVAVPSNGTSFEADLTADDLGDAKILATTGLEPRGRP